MIVEYINSIILSDLALYKFPLFDVILHPYRFLIMHINFFLDSFDSCSVLSVISVIFRCLYHCIMLCIYI